MSTDARMDELLRRIEQLEIKARTAEDYMAICNLQAAYGYYVDKTLYDEAADLFARDARLEIAGRGLFVGQERVRKYLHALPKLEFGCVFNHMQLQPVISIAADGRSARGRWRNFIQIGWLGREARWGEGTYENEYLREDGVWKIEYLHFYTTYYVEFEKGWNHGGVPLAGPLPGMEPDRTLTVDYKAFPHVFVPPYHYTNPVTGQPLRKR
ncbi:MAG TPA: nuclear transport factor 2 family protein [Steroidobacteraceae bacterium]|nr:nuclear transport factor 2 family protein [Steroidobacteraceae bacterium]